MGFMDEYYKALKDDSSKSGSGGTNGGSSGGSSSFMEEYYNAGGHAPTRVQRPTIFSSDYDIAPVADSVFTRMTVRRKKKEEEEKKKRKWFEKGLFEDGYDVGDITKTILGTAGDVATGVVKGFTSGVEGIVDLGSYGVAGVLDAFGKDDDADMLRRTTAESQTDQLWGGLEAIADKYSILGEKADSVIDPITNALGYIGMMYATAGIGAAAGVSGVGATALSTGTMFASSAGGSMGEAYQGGASDEEALKHGVMKGAVDAGSELIFGGLGKAAKTLGLSRGLSSLDDIFAKKLSDKISNHFWKNAVQYGVKASAEGVEEVLAGLGSAVSKKLTYMSDEDLSKLIKDENLMEQFAVGTAASAIMQSGFVPGTTEGSFKESVTTGRDFITGQTQNEQAVIKKELENRVSEKEKDGTKLTNKEKAAIEEQVVKDMEKGYISTDTIEEVLGGESYQNYKKTLSAEDAQIESLKKQLKELEGAPNTVGNSKKYDALQAKLETMNKRNKSTDLKTRLENEVYNLAKGDRLAESYNERTRRSQKFEADVTKYDAKQQAVIQKAIDSGILNNTNRTHEFVDIISKISADKGVLFDFTNNAKLKESGFAVDGRQVNGFVTKDGISLNIDSPQAWQKTVGHEVTHVLEGTEFYTELQKTLFDYAESKGELGSRFDTLKELYKDVQDADVNAELTADLVGEYLFTDEDFIKNLSTEHRNVFQKIYDEIKYLCKVATGSKESRELERVKRAFENAYRAGGKTQTTSEQKTYAQNASKTEEFENWRDYVDAVIEPKTDSARYDKVNYETNRITNENAVYFAEQEVYRDVKSGMSSADLLKKSQDLMDEYNQLQSSKKVGEFTEAEKMTMSVLLHQSRLYKNEGRKSQSGTKYSLSDSTGRQLTKEQQEYFKDSKVRDENGNLKVMYHGTANGGHNIFDIYGRANHGLFGLGAYFTEDPEVALSYTQKGKTKPGKAPKIYEAYLNIKNPLDMDAKAKPEEWITSFPDADFPSSGTNEEFYRAVEEYYADQWMSKWEAASEIQETLQFGMGYDGITHIGGGRFNKADTNRHRVYITFDSEQIKNLDNLKPTDHPDIRYSLSDSTGEVTEEQNNQGLNRAEEVSYSLSKDTEYMDKAIAMNASSLRVDTKALEETKALRERIASRMNDIKDRGLVGLPEDIEGNTYIANSSYDGTEENTTICPRSLASEAFVDAVSEYLGRPLTVEEQIYISQDLQGRSLTPECTYCYVATDRKAYRAFLGEYVAQRDAVLEKVKGNPNADVSRSGELYKEFLNGRKDTNPMYNRFKMWVDAYKNGKPMIDASHLANINKLMGDINSEFGAELKPQITDAMKYAQSASWAKKRVNYVAYNGHILKWKQDRINKLNSHYGLRMYSFSDFHPAFVLENMQMITDASVRGLKMLGYTKDTDFVEIFAPSGMNINISTFGFETSGEVFENNLIGAEWEKAKALREQYPNVGITFVATNDTLVDWALNQDWIDVVIPFHLVRTGREVAKAFNYHDYTSESSDTKTKDWKKGDKKYIAPTEHNNDKATYLAALESNHLKPRFERFKDRPNYMKLVNECRQPASASKPVQPTFNEDAAMVALAKLEANGYYQPIGGSVDRMYEIAGEVAETMTKELAPSMSLSNTGEQHTSDSLSALRLETDDVAPVAEKSSVVAEKATEAPIYESKDRSEPEGQTTMFEPVEEKKTTWKEYHQSIIDNIKDRFDEKGFDFDKVLKGAKNLSTWSTVDNTPQRVMEKALGYKEGGILADITVNKVAQNETEGIKWLNSYVDQLKQISKQYHIKPGSKESAAAQMFAEGFYVNENNEIVRYGEPELIQDFKDPKDRENIKRLARDPRIRKIYDDTLAMINESRTRNLYPEIPRLDNYFLHFRAMNDTFSTLGLPFNPNDIRAKDLPTDLNGVTADLKPGQPYFASANHRTGKRTSFDMLGGIERYLTSAKNQIYHIDDIQTLRALRNYIAETYGQATGLEDIDNMTDAEAEERIKQVYGSHLSTFAKFLNEEANVLAGKTALIDRGLEGIIGRRGITFLNTLNGQVGSNMVGYNISSSLTNFLPVAQTFAKSNKFDFIKAFGQTALNKLSGGRFDAFAEDSPVVIRRKGEDRFYRTPWQKIADPGYALMGMVDDVSTEIIARTKYNEFTRKGMDSQKAHFETDKWVSKLMGDRSLGQQPQLYNSKMLGLITKFQLEVRNQLDAQFYDTIQETKASNEHIQNGLARNVKTAAQVASTFTQLAVAQHLFGKAFESVAGYNPAFDIIEVLATAFGFDDDEESEDTALDNFAQGLLALAEDMPYASTFTGGRIPISDAIPDVNAILRGEDEYGNEIGIPQALVENVAEIAPYYLMPAGYGQAKKTIAGLKMFSDEHPIAGSYTDAGNLRFPVEDTLGNKIHAGIFGQYASENARKYFDEEQRTLNADQTEIFAGLDIPIEEYWEYRDNLYDFYDVKDELEAAAKADGATDEDILKGKYIKSVYSDIYDLYDKQKEIAKGNSSLKKSQLRDIQKQMSNMLTDSKRTVNNVNIDGYYATIGDKRYDYSDYNGAWFEISGKYLKNEQKAIERYGVTPSFYWNNQDMFYDADYYFKYKPELETVSKNVFDGKWFAGYAAEVSQIKGDDLNGDGKSDSGTKKEKVFNYISGLDVGDVEKMILYKMSYPAVDDYNDYILDYLNNRDDLTYDVKKSMLEALGATLDDEGYIDW